MRVSVKRCIAAGLVLGLAPRTIQLTNMIDGATISSNIASFVSGYILDQMIDGVWDKITIADYPNANEYIEINLERIKEIQTIWMSQNRGSLFPTNNPQVKIYIGNVPATNANYKTSNSLCYTGGTEGLAVCATSLTGQYLIIELLTAGTDRLTFGDIYAWNKNSLAHTVDTTTATLTDIVV